MFDSQEALSGNVPDNVRSSATALEGMWQRIVMDNPELANDLAAKDEWLALIGGGANRSYLKNDQVAYDEVREELKGMGEMNIKASEQEKMRLLRLESQMHKDEVARRVAAGLPIGRMPPRGSILGKLGML